MQIHAQWTLAFKFSQACFDGIAHLDHVTAGDVGDTKANCTLTVIAHQHRCWLGVATADVGNIT
ncbi:hypothetical protein DN37_3204 [Vibrio cholerae]|nr:hypothetical protein DN37_3204 [Vibrio cholerae]